MSKKNKKKQALNEMEFNVSLWHWYPLGQVDAAWALIGQISHQTDNKYPKEVEAVFDALQKLDDKIRADRYPFPKKKKVK
jgi:hypothetical protein